MIGERIYFFPEDFESPWQNEFSATCGYCNHSSLFKLIQVTEWIKKGNDETILPWARMKIPDQQIEWISEEENEDEDEAFSEKTYEVSYSIYQCLNCKDLTFIKWARTAGESRLITQKIYPVSQQLDFEVTPGGPIIMLPQIVDNAYRQAKTVERTSPVAFALLIRRALEAICKERGIEKGTLANKLNTLLIFEKSKSINPASQF